MIEVNTAPHLEFDRDWNKPTDWRMVTVQSMHKYIPFEQQNVNLSIAFNHVKEMLARYEPTKNNSYRYAVMVPVP